MAHVQIKTGSASPSGAASIIVDGVDLSLSILAEGFSIEGLDAIAEYRKPVATMRVVCDSLDIDLPDSVLDALSASRESGVA